MKTTDIINTLRNAIKTSTAYPYPKINAGNDIIVTVYDDGSGSIDHCGERIGWFDFETHEWALIGCIGGDPYSYEFEEEENGKNIFELMLREIAEGISRLANNANYVYA